MPCVKCGFETDAETCPRCGVIFAKLKPTSTAAPAPITPPPIEIAPDEESVYVSVGVLRQLALASPSEPSLPMLAGRALLLLVILVWSWTFLTASVNSDRIMESVMHLVHLPFHEAGHVFFSPFGTFMAFFGGTLGQLLMPLICLVVFLLKTHDGFAAAVCLWWLGQSFVDCAPYINDATRLQLVMVSGEMARDTAGHDWENMLSLLGWLRYDQLIATVALHFGNLLLILALFWGVFWLRVQANAIKRGPIKR